ncbi:hypothetical protein HanRHA438_Chr01g0036511 [Helianthus annuus]|nr:hypothetical protein HanRHA438_Chr01g0036511 [Helianthus annuus]
MVASSRLCLRWWCLGWRLKLVPVLVRSCWEWDLRLVAVEGGGAVARADKASESASSSFWLMVVNGFKSLIEMNGGDDDW